MKKTWPKTNLTHGLSNHPFYWRWSQMMARCHNPSAHNYAWYGGRSIAVCEAWHDPSAFLAWCDLYGRADEQIDRIDNDGNYSPENCRFVTHKRNMRNLSNNLLVTLQGEVMTCGEAAEKLGLKYTTLYQRIVKLGWPEERALSAPLRKIRRRAA